MTRAAAVDLPRTADHGGAGRGGATKGGAISRVVRVLRRLPAAGLLGLLRAYQLVVSPWTPPTCRYYPSCSQYAVVAVRRHGALRGGWLAARRLGRCHPWSPGGVDDVPPARTPAHAGEPATARSTTR